MSNPFPRRRGLRPVLPALALALACCSAPPTEDRGEEGKLATTSTKQALVTAAVGEWAWNAVAGSHCGNGDETGFAVNLGTSSELVIAMMGGGECWDEFTCGLRINGTPLAMWFEDGFNENTFRNKDWFHNLDQFDRDNPNNPYKDASYVFVPYCTGDFHLGSNTQWFSGKQKTAYFTGRQNLDLYLNLIGPAFQNASRVTLTGTSAGAFGAQVHYERVRNAFGGNKRVDLVADSGPYLYSSNTIIFNPFGTWGAASSFPSGCPSCATNLRNLYAYYDNKYPDSRFAFLSNDMDILISTAYPQLFYPQFYDSMKSLATNTLQPLLRTRFFIPHSMTHTLLIGGMGTTAQPRKCEPGFLGTCNPVNDGAPTTLGSWLNDMMTDSPNWKNATGMIMAQCTPTCTGSCGADGCGGVCGSSCGTDMSCHPSNQCLYNKGCTINGVNYDTGTRNPALACQVCDPSADPFGWSLAPDMCFINGQCKASGEADSGAGCTECRPGKSRTAWTVNSSCNVVGVTKGNKTGAFGYANAASTCATDAGALDLDGTWTPLLATNSKSYIDRVPLARRSRPVVNIRGEQLFASWDAVFTNQVWPSGTSVYRFNNTAFTGKVWTGALADGTTGKRCMTEWDYPSGEGWSNIGYWTGFLLDAQWKRPYANVGDFAAATRQFYNAAATAPCDEPKPLACVLVQ